MEQPQLPPMELSAFGGVEGIVLNGHHLRAPYGRGPDGKYKASLQLIYDALNPEMPREGEKYR